MVKLGPVFFFSKDTLVLTEIMVGLHAKQGLVGSMQVQVLGDCFTWHLAPPSAARLLPSGRRDGDRRSPSALMTVSSSLQPAQL